MANFAAVLKDEIRRLAAKEARVVQKQAAKASAGHRREIAALKRQNLALEKKLSSLWTAQTKLVASAGKNGLGAVPTPKPMRFSPKWLAKHRAKIKLSAEQYAKLAGVSAQSVYHWETGKSKPRVSQLHALAKVRLLGYREALVKLQELTGKKPGGRRRGRKPGRKPGMKK